MKRIGLLLLMGFLASCDQLGNSRPAAAASSPPAVAPPTQQTAPAEIQLPPPVTPDKPRFRLYKTGNMWTFWELDTRTGHVWQLEYAVNKGERATYPVSMGTLADTDEDGRFTMSPTENIYTGILLDTKDGRAWQCQFSQTSKSERFCLSIADDNKDEFNEDPGPDAKPVKP